MAMGNVSLSLSWNEVGPYCKYAWKNNGLRSPRALSNLAKNSLEQITPA